MHRIMVLLRFLALSLWLSAAGAGERYFDAGGVRIRYVDTGSGPAVHGRSDKPHDPRAYDEIGFDVIRLRDHAGVGRGARDRGRRLPRAHAAIRRHIAQ